MANKVTVDTRAFQAGMNSRLQTIGQQTRDAARRYMESARERAAAHIHSVSGELAGSLQVDDHLDEKPPYIGLVAKETGPGHPHGVEHEFGTSDQAPHPFLRPALEEARADFKP